LGEKGAGEQSHQGKRGREQTDSVMRQFDHLQKSIPPLGPSKNASILEILQSNREVAAEKNHTNEAAFRRMASERGVIGLIKPIQAIPK
jgi:hypothetical protein